MDRVKNVSIRIGMSVLCAALFPVIAYAQVPSYAQPSNASGEETIHGRIASIFGQFDLAVRDDRGFVDSVQLHSRTSIYPSGVALAPGMSVTIVGYNRGKVFAANEIVTSYTSSYDEGPAYQPVYAYGADPYWAWNAGPVYGGWYGFGWGYGGWYGAGYGRGGSWGGHGGDYGRGGGGYGHGGGGYGHGGGGRR
jgi:hypothetical protein